MHEKLQKAREIEQALAGLFNDLVVPLASGKISLEDQLDIGRELWKTAWSVGEMLEEIKTNLRAEAVERKQGKSGKVFLESGSGTRCTVTIPETKARVRKNADMGALKKLLGTDFPAVFEEIVTFKPRKDFSTEASRCASEAQPAIMEAVEMVDETPSVWFKK